MKICLTPVSCLAAWVTLRLFPGSPDPGQRTDDADALMVRSVTKVNEALLAGKAIKFVGTATAGTDHVDDKWLKQAGIGFSAAPGCNAIAVVEYVFSSLLMLAERDGFALKDRTVGIVGVGNVGGRLQKAPGSVRDPHVAVRSAAQRQRR